MAVVQSVNGKTGDVVINAAEVLTDVNSGKTVEFAITTASYRATTSKIQDTEDDYLLMITKGA